MANAKVSNITITVAVAAIIVVAVIGTIIASAKNNTGATGNSQTAMTTKPTKATTTPVADTNKTYKDGTYTAKGSYNSPGGEETVTVTVTLAGNIVTDSTVVGNGDPGVSGSYQAMFINNYKPMVVGKKVASIHLSHVSGSSLTSKGFNLALASIEKQAS